MTKTEADKFDPSNNVDLGDNPVEVKKAGGVALLEKYGLTDRFYFDPGNRGLYWHCTADGEWMGESGREFEEMLSDVYNIEATRSGDYRLSEVKQIARQVKSYSRVDFVGAIAGFKKGLIENNGQRVLVTREAKIMQPTSGEWPVLDELFTQMFGHGSPDIANEGPDQLPYLYGTWKHALECLNEKFTDKRILCLALAGSAGSGKSLIKDLISLTLGGRECKPYDFMIGKENFNGDFIGSEVWVMDDEQGGDTAMKARLTFGANLKKAVADRYYRIRGMMRDGVVLEMFRFPLICLNREPERLKVLPPLDDDIADKISVLLAHKHPMPMQVGTPAEKTVFWSTLMAELPHFVYYLLNEHTIPSRDYGRFGMKHFHHPELCSDLFQVSTYQVLWDHIQKTLFRADDEFADWWWEGSTTKLRELLVSDDSPLTKAESGRVHQSNHLGRSISTIAKQFPEQLWKHQVEGKAVWLIVKPGKTVAEARELRKINKSYKS